MPFLKISNQNTMKKLYALIALAVVGGFSAHAQLARKTAATKNVGRQTISSKSIVTRHANNPNTTNAVIWSDGFSTPANWSITSEAGTSGDWVIGTTGPAGGFPITTIASASAANGFAKFDSDSICTHNQIGNLTSVNPIDVTGHSAVRLTFSQYYRRYYDSTYIFISTDNINWTKFEVNGALTLNQYSANNNAINPNIVSVDISSVAANQATVYVRFQFYSPTSIDAINAGCAYSWMIDDISISDIPGLDIEALQNVRQGEYAILPVLDAAALIIQGRIHNSGTQAITSASMSFNVYNTTSGLVYSGTEAFSGTLNPGDTSALIVNTVPYTPVDTGIYYIEQVVATAGDVDGSNDTTYSYVYVSDSVYARDYIDFDPNNFAGSFGFPGFAGTLGQMYHIYQSSQTTSATIYLAGPRLGDHVAVSVYDVAAGLPNAIIGASNPYTITAADTGGAFITLPFSAPVNILANTDYFLGVEQIDTNNISLGASHDIYTGGKIFYNGGTAWRDVDSAGIKIAFIARLNTPSSTLVGINNVKNNEGFSVYPNPSKGFVYILNNGTSTNVKVNVINAMGQVVKSTSFNSFSSEKIDLSNQAAGTYTVQMITDKGVTNKTVVVSAK